MSSTRRPRWKNLGLLGAGTLLGASLTCARSAPPEDHHADRSPASIAGALFTAQPAFARAVADGRATTLADIAERVVPSVVNLSAQRTAPTSPQQDPMMEDPLFREFFGPGGPWEAPPDGEARSLGSGVVIGTDGIILTSAHVVEGAEQVEVTLHDGRELEATVVGSDPQTDLAVIRLEGDPPSGLTPIRFGDSTRLRLGDVVLAIGNPFGVGQTVTMGIVSATGRTRVGIVEYEDFIQTDAAINPGNSGGALINMSGEMVGINTAILSRSGGYQGIGFATPTAMAAPILRSLLQHGRVTRGWLGVTIQEVDRDMAEALDLPPRGIVVADVTPGGPGARAGLRRGDVIQTLDGEVIRSSPRFRNRVASLAPGSTIQLEVLRDGAVRRVAVRLGTLPGTKAEVSRRPASGGASEADDEGLLSGITVTDLTPRARRKIDLPRRFRGGVVITAVAPGSRAEAMGLAVGDVLLEVDRQPIGSSADFRRKARRLGDAVIVLIYRGDTSLYLAGRR